MVCPPNTVKRAKRSSAPSEIIEDLTKLLVIGSDDLSDLSSLNRSADLLMNSSYSPSVTVESPSEEILIDAQIKNYSLVDKEEKKRKKEDSSSSDSD